MAHSFKNFLDARGNNIRWENLDIDNFELIGNLLLLLLLLSRFSRVQLCDPIDGSPPGSSIHGIFQARVLEWAAIVFSKIGSLGYMNSA